MEWEEIASDPDSPLLNRVTQGSYQPGTVLNPYLLAWSIQEGIVQPGEQAPNLKVPVIVNGPSLTCLLPLLHVDEGDYAKALLYGCPSPFYSLGQELGAESFNQMLATFGFFEEPEVRLPLAEAAEPVIYPDDEALGMAAVGQGELTISPLQLARAFAGLISTRGLPALRVVEFFLPQGGEWQELAPLGAGHQVLNQDVHEQILAVIRGEGDLPFGQRAQAIAGEEGEVLGWYQGGLIRGEDSFVVVVVIEGQNPIVAERIGRNLLNLIRSEGIP
jgi:hypothetical protein